MGVPGAAPWDTLPGMPSPGLGMRAPRRGVDERLGMEW